VGEQQKMKNIIRSGFIVLAVAAIAGYGTYSYFSDTETSTGNTFTAGAIDLKIANQHSYSGPAQNDHTSNWSLGDLSNQVYFSFSDLKPGDWGENTVTLQVDNNDSWVCANAYGVEDENGLVDPEVALSDTTDTGELGQYLNFVWWVDDGDNKLESGENILFGGPVTFGYMMNAAKNDAYVGDDNLYLTLTDSTHNIYGNVGDTFPGATPKYLGIGWCLGTLNPDYSGDAGFSCSGNGDQNMAQTDKIKDAILSFSAVQSRNNTSFSCKDTVRGGGR
jgi:predicted ribosomally synthesized peptide with SipW-like signal peptide